MGKYVDHTGKRFGRVIALECVDISHGRAKLWKCRCDCGNEFVTVAARLVSGHTQSCGCYKRELSKLRHLTHGQSDTRLFRIWCNMKDRCHGPIRKDYPLYGGRGIKVCDEWLNSFETFCKWALNNGYKDNLTLDRKDNNKDYSPENCRWVDYRTQARNRRSNHLIEYQGQTKTLTEWSEILGINRATLSSRLKRTNGDIEKALITPIRKKQEET